MLAEELIDLAQSIQKQKAEAQITEVKSAHLGCPKRKVGDADLPMTDYEIYSYDAYRKHLHDDERPVERADWNLLNRDRLTAYILERKSRKPQFSLLDDDTIYEMLNLSRNHLPTLASIMNFGIYPQGLFPQLCITAISVPGYEIGDIGTSDERFTDNRRIEGTLSEMLDAALIFCRNNMKTGTFIDPQTGKRTDRTEYPVKAIREAVLNALIHRDYSVHTEGTPIQINFFKDRLEIHSPGNLYGRMTVEQLGHARPDLRNPALATMAENLLQAENRYSGIPTIRREMKTSGLPEPVFENRRNEFVVTLYNGTEYNPPQDSPAVSHKAGNQPENPDSGLAAHAAVSDRMKGLLEYCRTPRSRKEIADFLNIKTTFYIVANYINPLLEKGLLQMTIPDRPKSRLQKYYTVEKAM